MMWMKTAKVSIQDKYLKTSFTKLSNIFSNLNEISRKIQQLPCKKMHLRSVCKMAVILCGSQYITCVQWLCLRQNSRNVSNWIVKENTNKSFIKGNQFENIGKMTATLSRPESVKTSWPKLNALYLEECASKFIFKSRCSLDPIWCNLN